MTNEQQALAEMPIWLVIVLAVIELWLVRRLLAGSGNARIVLLSVASVAASWRCDVVKALGEQAGATVTYVNGIATVSITWGERVGAGENPNTTFVATSRL